MTLLNVQTGQLLRKYQMPFTSKVEGILNCIQKLNIDAAVGRHQAD